MSSSQRNHAQERLVFEESDSDSSATSMCTNNRTNFTNHDFTRVHRFELGDECVNIRTVGGENGQLTDSGVGRCLTNFVNEKCQSFASGALLATLLDDSVAYFNDGLDREN